MMVVASRLFRDIVKYPLPWDLSFVKSLSIPHPKEKALGQLPEVLYDWPPSPGAKHRLVHKYSVQQKI